MPPQESTVTDTHQARSSCGSTNQVPARWPPASTTATCCMETCRTSPTSSAEWSAYCATCRRTQYLVLATTPSTRDCAAAHAACTTGPPSEKKTNSKTVTPDDAQSANRRTAARPRCTGTLVHQDQYRDYHYHQGWQVPMTRPSCGQRASGASKPGTGQTFALQPNHIAPS